MKKNLKNNPKLVYKMSEVNDMFSKEEIAEMSEYTEFNPEDEYFHFDSEAGWIESLNEEDIDFYNANVPNEEKLIMVQTLKIK